MREMPRVDAFGLPPVAPRRLTRTVASPSGPFSAAPRAGQSLLPATYRGLPAPRCLPLVFGLNGSLKFDDRSEGLAIT